MQTLFHLCVFRDPNCVKGSQKYLPSWILGLLQVNTYYFHYFPFRVEMFIVVILSLFHHWTQGMLQEDNILVHKSHNQESHMDYI